MKILKLLLYINNNNNNSNNSNKSRWGQRDKNLKPNCRSLSSLYNVYGKDDLQITYVWWLGFIGL